METVYLLIPVALLLIAVIVLAMFWAIKSGQFDDLQGPAHQILWDDDSPPAKPRAQDGGKSGKEQA